MSRVTFQSDGSEEIPASDRHRLQPLLGYDWIAGTLYGFLSLLEFFLHTSNVALIRVIFVFL